MQPDEPYIPDHTNGPANRPSRSLRAQRTNPALPGVTMPTVPMAPATPAYPGTSPAAPQPGAQARHRTQPAIRSMWKLLGLGFLLALAYLLLYPLFAVAVLDHAGAKSALSALIGLFPWLPHLYWTAWPPLAPVARLIGRLPAFDLSGPGGSANFLLVGFVIASCLFLVAARVARNVGRERLAAAQARTLLWIILGLAALFALLFLFAPAVMTQDALLYGWYGRMALIYHTNPYLASTLLPTDLLNGVITGPPGHPAFGPVWMDAALAIALAARGSVANILMDFRLLALVIHLANVLLVWRLLTRLHPEARFVGTLLYAWNPALLVLGIAEMHLELVVIFFILLAALFFQRRALFLSWVCLLLAALIQPLSLLLMPLFLRLYGKSMRGQSAGRRVVWWLGLIAVSILIVGLAYAPYYSGWGLSGIATQLRLAFLPNTAVNSLDAAIQHLHISANPAIAWFAAPLTWTILTVAVAGCLLLLGFWLTENLEFALLFASWLYLAIVVLSPSYLAWSTFLPLALAICSGGTRTTLLALLLAGGALLSYYFNLSSSPWGGQGLVTIGLPVLVWGWSLFFASTWRMTRAGAGVGGQSSGQLSAVRPGRGPRLSRPSWPSRPPWSGRR